MDLLMSALRWIFDSSHWQAGSQSPLPIQDRLVEHLTYTVIAVVIAAIIALALVVLSLWLVFKARRALRRFLEPKRPRAG